MVGNRERRVTLARRSLWIGLVLIVASACALWLAACDDRLDVSELVCTNDCADCGEDQYCAWVGDEWDQDGYRCVTTCQDDSDCSWPCRCVGHGSSCPACMDYIEYCR